MFGSIFYTNEPLVNVTQQLCGTLKLNITNSTIRETVLSHPDYPSLLSVSDSLNKWNIANAAIRIQSSDLDSLPEPFIGYVGGELKVITKIDEEVVHYIDSSGKHKTDNRQEFANQWQDVALLTEPSANSGEVKYNQKRNFEKGRELVYTSALAVLIVWAVFASVIFIETNSLKLSMAYIGALVCKIGGLITTVTLLWYEIDKYNSALKKICSGVGIKSDCNAVLNSSQAKLFSWLSWSEVGLFYFVGGFLSLLLMPSYLIIISWLNILVLPFIIYSLSYQYFVIKQWCPLCLTVQAILFLEFIISLLGGTEYLLNDLNSLDTSSLFNTVAVFGQMIFIFGLAPLVWVTIKPILLSAIKSDSTKFELNRLKGNSEIFNFIMSKQKVATYATDDLGIILGNPTAENKVIKVCNPYCDPCSNAHPDVKELLSISDNIRVQIIYNTSYSGYDKGMDPVRHFLTLYNASGQSSIEKALDTWYSTKRKDYIEFAEKFPIQSALIEQDDRLIAMHSWTEINQVSFTPTYFFNGKQLPSQFGLKDLTHFV